MAEAAAAPTIAGHGAKVLPAVEVDSYNIETRDDEGFVGDRASKGAFRAILDNWRKLARKDGEDPLGDEDSEELSKKQLDDALTGDDLEAAGLVHTAIEEYAQDFALVIRRYLKQKAWQKTERVVIGGGFRASRVGEMAIGRTGLILKAEKIDVELVPVRRNPDEAGLIGSLFLAPSWIFKGHDAVLAVDIGGTNIRAGVVETNLKRAADLSKAAVWKMDLWRHADEEKLSRDQAVERLIKMLDKLAGRAEKEGFNLAPFIGIGCPGIISEDGSIDRGVQNLPGNWASKSFSLPAALVKGLPKIAGEDTAILLHNDAVVQGLSETPFMQDVKRWGVLTIGTGLGNARFTNRDAD